MPITSKFPGKCAECGGKFPAGATILYDKENGARHAVCPTGERANGTLAVPAPAPAVLERKPIERSLVEDANDLVDTYAKVLDRALTLHQGRVKPDEVRALVISAYIQRGRNHAA